MKPGSLPRRAVGTILRKVGLLPPHPSPRTVDGLTVNIEVLPSRPGRPIGAHETGYSDLADLAFRVAHAFESPAHARRQSYEPISKLIQANERVLDIGCGDGTFLDLVRARGARGIGVDLDPARVEECRRKGLEAYCVRVQEIDSVVKEKLDFVSMIHIIEHIVPAEALEILGAVTRSLSDDGRIFLVTPNISHPGVQTNFWLDITHTRPYPEALLVTMMATLGFPYFQSGRMSDDTEVWGYGFRKPEHALGYREQG